MSATYSLFFNRLKGLNLTNKLSLLVTFGVFVSIGVLSCYFDSFLEDNFLEDTNKRMLYGFQHLASDLKSVSHELLKGVSFIQTDEHFLASVNLINNYQDKNNYNAALLDEEKKSLARQLLSRVKLSLNHFIVLWDKNEELIAFVEHRENGYHLHFISYEEGKRILYSRHEDQKLFVKHSFPKTLPVDFKHRS